MGDLLSAIKVKCFKCLRSNRGHSDDTSDKILFCCLPKSRKESYIKMIESNEIVISTGNILNVNKKAGQKTNEELFDCLKLTLSDPVVNAKTGQIFRNNDDLAAKVTEYERENVKIGAKIFINRACPQQLQEAIDALLNILQVASLDNLILAYHPIEDTEQLLHTNGVPNGINGGGGGSSSSTTLNSDIASFSTTPKENGFLRWGDSDALTDLKQLWKIIEKYANDGKITQLGVADLDHSAFVQLCKTCEIKPTIAQINLSACCVVPPLLQEFCAANDIQLLTHSDPEVVLSRSAFNELESDILNSFKPIWTSRYQVHIRCRGVLTAKGFIVGAERE